ncbi:MULTISPECIES: GNAT family N-acetyltransferase [unclassified Leisingera]|uniref:GNAT family N-acetyltransferase n=2 Tax=Leisingera TaxID=191028 RepID=UPI0002F158B7|nr:MULTISPECIES: GNAT family N-acetyltransferase [unclassified Leisingera]
MTSHLSRTAQPGAARNRLTENYAVSSILLHRMGEKDAGRPAARAMGYDMKDAQRRYPRLVSKRLMLISPADPEFDAQAAFLAPDAPRFINVADDADSLWWSIATIIGHWHLHGYGLFAVVERSTGDTVGLVGPWFPKGWPEPELSWHLMETGEGKGYASEAVQCVLDWLFNAAGWDTIVSYVPEENTASIALARRAGAQPERLVSFPLQPAPGLRCWRHSPAARRSGPEAARGLLH